MPTARTYFRDVRILKSDALSGPTTVVVEQDRIVHVGDTIATQGTDVMITGGVLLPGLIDAHVHLLGPDDLQALSRHGVTTCLDMGSWPASKVAALRALEGTCDVRSAGALAVPPGSFQTHIPGFPADAIVAGPDDAALYVERRATEGSDYVKVFLAPPGSPGAMDQATATALAAAAREHGLLSIAHASTVATYAMALDAEFDVLTHAPLDAPLPQPLAERMASEGRIAVPTLTMMRATATTGIRPGLDYEHARTSVAIMHRAGVPLLAGTDANSAPGAPASVSHGSSLADELDLLVDAGLSPWEVLQAATSLPAAHFGLPDRGVIGPDQRADLLLLQADPLDDISALRGGRRVWAAGLEVPTS